MDSQNKYYLGIELGSTRIKSVLIDEKATTISQGVFEWENIIVDGMWSYSLEDAIFGLQESFRDLSENYKGKHGCFIEKVDAIGISAMMHGYIVLDKNDKQLAPFRTWRNTNAKTAAEELSELLDFNIPMRWSVSQYYYSILEGMPHVKDISFLTTLSGYIHYLLTGEKLLGINDASGMFPVDGKSYDKEKLKKFNDLIKSKGIDIDFESILPKVLVAGMSAGYLTESGAKLLDPSGHLQFGCVCCPPEGDMGTGLIATNSVASRNANISLGTSANLTVVLEQPLKRHYNEVDIVSTPDGKHCALLHSNNCTGEINAWAGMFKEVLSLFGVKASTGDLLTKLFNESDNAEMDLGKLFGYNFLAGEPMAGTTNGLLLVGRPYNGNLNLADFMKLQIFSAISTISLGFDLLDNENVIVDSIIGHGGFFKTERIGQIATSAAFKGVPVTINETASEGGAWGIAVLALYLKNNDKTLSDFLNEIFKEVKSTTLQADEKDVNQFNTFFVNYKKYLKIEKIGSEL